MYFKKLRKKFKDLKIVLGDIHKNKGIDFSLFNKFYFSNVFRYSASEGSLVVVE